jgi:hypothetical protein
MQEMKDTYYGKVVQKYAAEFGERMQNGLKEAKDIDAAMLAGKLAILQALIECVNDLDSRVRKLEQRT